MQRKLTLKLEDSVIRRAKQYARSHHRSLSKMVEFYFRSVAEEKRPGERKALPPVVASLSGLLKGGNKRNTEAQYADYIKKKYDA